jgi:hypothetical protein
MAGNTVSQTFATVGAAAQKNIVPIATVFRQAPTQWAAPVTAATLGIKTGFTNNIGGLAPVAQTAFGTTKQVALTQTGQMSTGVVGYTNTMSVGAIGSANSMNQGVIAQALGMSTGAIGQAGTMQKGVVSSSARMASGATASANAMASGVTAAAATATLGVLAQVLRWPGIVSSVSGGMRSAGFAAGSAAGQGVAAGLRSATASVANEAARLMSIVQAAMNAKALISSPSKMTMAIGEDLGMGNVVGMQNTEDANRRAGESLVSSVAAGMGGAMARPSLFANVSSIASTVPAGMPIAAGLNPSSGGDSYVVNVNVSGPVYGMDDLESRIGDIAVKQVLPPLIAAVGRTKRSQGYQRVTQ